MSNLNLSQQRGIFDCDYAKPVTLIGAGAVGSQVAAMLAKLGVPKITVYDGDALESHNISASLVWEQNDLGRYKVEALKSHIFRQSGLEIKAIERMYAGEPLTGTVVACVDNMEARSLIWKEVRDNPNMDIFVDTRMAQLFISVFAVAPCKDIAYYEHFLYPTEEAIRNTCGNHGIVFVTAKTAGIVCDNLTNWWENGKKKLHHKVLCKELVCLDYQE